MSKLRPGIGPTLQWLALGVCLIRLVTAFLSWRGGNDAPITAYAFSVLFPAVIILLLCRLPPTHTREGMLMRFAAILQMELILLLPGFALHLALGLPFAFLVVEVLMTRLPARIVGRLEKAILA